MSRTRVLVLGGARSGKSRHAEARVRAHPGAAVYLATAQAFDAEMTDRIARHRAGRGAGWETIEAPMALPETLAGIAPDRPVLVDCLTLWASNLLLADADADAATARLVAAIAARDGVTVLVANEVGLGIVPDNALARRFRDIAGTLNQAVAAACDTVEFVAAGLPIRLKG